MERPGIDISKLCKGTRVLAETETSSYLMTVLNPAHGLVEVCSTDARFHDSSVCQLLRSFDDNGEREYWVGKDMRMLFHFRNGDQPCSPTVSARVDGEGWFYNVF